MAKIVNRVKRGVLEGQVLQVENNRFSIHVLRGQTVVRKGTKEYYDLDEAEVELGSLIDSAWEEASGGKGKAVPKLY